LKQVSNRYGKGDLAIYGNAFIPAVKHLFAPIARESIFIKGHGRTSMVCAYGSPSGRCIRFAAQERQGPCRRTRSDLPVLMNGMLLQ
jgi:hypothetical protein